MDKNDLIFLSVMATALLIIVVTLILTGSPNLAVGTGALGGCLILTAWFLLH